MKLNFINKGSKVTLQVSSRKSEAKPEVPPPPPYVGGATSAVTYESKRHSHLFLKASQEPMLFTSPSIFGSSSLPSFTSEISTLSSGAPLLLKARHPTSLSESFLSKEEYSESLQRLASLPYMVSVEVENNARVAHGHGFSRATHAMKAPLSHPPRPLTPQPTAHMDVCQYAQAPPFAFAPERTNIAGRGLSVGMGTGISMALGAGVEEKEGNIPVTVESLQLAYTSIAPLHASGHPGMSSFSGISSFSQTHPFSKSLAHNASPENFISLCPSGLIHPLHTDTNAILPTNYPFPSHMNNGTGSAGGAMGTGMGVLEGPRKTTVCILAEVALNATSTTSSASVSPSSGSTSSISTSPSTTTCTSTLYSTSSSSPTHYPPYSASSSSSSSSSSSPPLASIASSHCTPSPSSNPGNPLPTTIPDQTIPDSTMGVSFTPTGLPTWLSVTRGQLLVRVSAAEYIDWTSQALRHDSSRVREDVGINSNTNTDVATSQHTPPGNDSPENKIPGADVLGNIVSGVGGGNDINYTSNKSPGHENSSVDTDMTNTVDDNNKLVDNNDESSSWSPYPVYIPSLEHITFPEHHEKIRNFYCSENTSLFIPAGAAITIHCLPDYAPVSSSSCPPSPCSSASSSSLASPTTSSTSPSSTSTTTSTSCSPCSFPPLTSIPRFAQFALHTCLPFPSLPIYLALLPRFSSLPALSTLGSPCTAHSISHHASMLHLLPSGLPVSPSHYPQPHSPRTLHAFARVAWEVSVLLPLHRLLWGLVYGNQSRIGKWVVAMDRTVEWGQRHYTTEKVNSPGEQQHMGTGTSYGACTAAYGALFATLRRTILLCADAVAELASAGTGKCVISDAEVHGTTSPTSNAPATTNVHANTNATNTTNADTRQIVAQHNATNTTSPTHASSVSPCSSSSSSYSPSHRLSLPRLCALASATHLLCPFYDTDKQLSKLHKYVGKASKTMFGGGLPTHTLTSGGASASVGYGSGITMHTDTSTHAHPNGHPIINTTDASTATFSHITSQPPSPSSLSLPPRTLVPLPSSSSSSSTTESSPLPSAAFIAMLLARIRTAMVYPVEIYTPTEEEEKDKDKEREKQREKEREKEKSIEVPDKPRTSLVFSLPIPSGTRVVANTGNKGVGMGVPVVIPVPTSTTTSTTGTSTSPSISTSAVSDAGVTARVDVSVDATNVDANARVGGAPSARRGKRKTISQDADAGTSMDSVSSVSAGIDEEEYVAPVTRRTAAHTSAAATVAGAGAGAKRSVNSMFASMYEDDSDDDNTNTTMDAAGDIAGVHTAVSGDDAGIRSGGSDAYTVPTASIITDDQETMLENPPVPVYAPLPIGKNTENTEDSEIPIPKKRRMIIEDDDDDDAYAQGITCIGKGSIQEIPDSGIQRDEISGNGDIDMDDLFGDDDDDVDMATHPPTDKKHKREKKDKKEKPGRAGRDTSISEAGSRRMRGGSPFDDDDDMEKEEALYGSGVVVGIAGDGDGSGQGKNRSGKKSKKSRNSREEEDVSELSEAISDWFDDDDDSKHGVHNDSDDEWDVSDVETGIIRNKRSAKSGKSSGSRKKEESGIPTLKKQKVSRPSPTVSAPVPAIPAAPRERKPFVRKKKENPLENLRKALRKFK